VHELSIAENIIDRVSNLALENGWRDISEIGLRVGELSGVDPEALRFSFEAASLATPLAGCRLEIEKEELAARCNQCGEEFRVRDWVFRCPRCNVSEVTVVRGQDFQITYVTVE
jgi:hydrogenase nickel incorporation protein HypA/HybF